MTTEFDNIQYWDTRGSSFNYPETDQSNELHCRQLISRPNSGICVSGGGTVSASLIAGYFDALTELQLMENIRYISGVSGGTWGSAPYVYLPENQTGFSGITRLPGDIQLDQITKPEGTPPGSMQYAAVHADLVQKYNDYLLKQHLGNRAYEMAVGSVFLNPFDIPSPASPSPAAQFFSTTPEVVRNIKSRNPAITNDFLTIGDDRPFLIMNATMFVPPLKESKDDPPHKGQYPFEITPLYAGIKAEQTLEDGTKIGGFFVESFGFNTTLTSLADDVATATGDQPFELCQPVGASGSALEDVVEKIPAAGKILPQFYYWNPLHTPIPVPSPPPVPPLYNFGDGGCLEDTGIMPLLARSVENIAVLLTEPVFFPDKEKAGCPGFFERAFGYNQIAYLFGQPTIDRLEWLKHPLKPMPYIKDTSGQVFEADQFPALLERLWEARNSGGPIVVKMQMQMKKDGNTLFGVMPAEDYQPTVIWSVVDTCTNWENGLNKEVSDYMANHPGLRDFPKVRVFGQNIGTVIALSYPQANLLADFGYWMVTQSADTFKNVLLKR